MVTVRVMGLSIDGAFAGEGLLEVGADAAEGVVDVAAEVAVGMMVVMDDVVVMVHGVVIIGAGGVEEERGEASEQGDFKGSFHGDSFMVDY